MSSELLKAQSHCISTECIHSTFRNLINSHWFRNLYRKTYLDSLSVRYWLRSFDWTSPYDEKTRSTQADDATDFNSLRWNSELQLSKLVSVITTTQLATWMTAHNKFLW